MRARRKNRLVQALLGAMGAGLLLWSLPVGFIETVVASSGLSEALPAAAPPLGMKARLLLAGFGGLMALGLIWTGRREQGVALLTHAWEGRDRSAAGVSKMGFALSKLSWLSRRGEASRRSGPALRRADAHPDAPARAPIFASRDFGGLDIFARTAPGRGENEAGADPVDSPPAALAISGGPERADREAFVPLTRALPAGEPVEAVPPAPLPAATQGLSIAQLTERLEQGLTQRKRAARPVSVLADMPVEPAVPVRDQVEKDVDEALRAALGTLRSMTARAR
jgi:hypothetical protein